MDGLRLERSWHGPIPSTSATVTPHSSPASCAPPGPMVLTRSERAPQRGTGSDHARGARTGASTTELLGGRHGETCISPLEDRRSRPRIRPGCRSRPPLDDSLVAGMVGVGSGHPVRPDKRSSRWRCKRSASELSGQRCAPRPADKGRSSSEERTDPVGSCGLRHLGPAQGDCGVTPCRSRAPPGPRSSSVGRRATPYGRPSRAFGRRRRFAVRANERRIRFRVQHFGEVGVVAALVGRYVAGIGYGVTLVGGGQSGPGGGHSLGLGGLALRHSGLALRNSGLTFRHVSFAAFKIDVVRSRVGFRRVGELIPAWVLRAHEESEPPKVTPVRLAGSSSPPVVQRLGH